MLDAHPTDPHVPDQLTRPAYRRDIDGLRACAVLAVIGFHAFPTWIRGGFVGVDMFFVVSGFLITTLILENLGRGTFSFGTFYVRRVRRIFPALILVLVAVCVIGWAVLLAPEYRQLGKHVAGAAGFVANVQFWEEAGYFDTTSELKPLLHLWSVAIEEQFYVVWPVLLWAIWRRPRSLIIVIVALVAASLGYSVYALGSDATAAFYLPHARAWELLSGALLAALLLRSATNFPKPGLSPPASSTSTRSRALVRGGSLVTHGLSVLGALAVLASILAFNRGMRFPGPSALLPVVGTMLIIAAGPDALLNRTLLSSSVAVGVGLISYPLYLWHWPLLALARIVDAGPADGFIRVAVLFLAGALAWFTYRFVEGPVRFGPYGRFKAATLLALMACVGGAGYAVLAKDGLPGRPRTAPYKPKSALFSLTRTLGRSPEAKIMLLGDSHAVHLAQGFTKEFGTLAADYAASGCIPLFGVDRYDSRFKPGTCLKAMTEALQLFEESPTMTVVVLSSMGPLYLTGETFNGIDPARVAGLGVTLASNPALTDRWAVYAEGLADTARRLAARHKRIVFAFDVPELGFDPRACFDTRPFRLSALRPVCAVPRAEYDARVGRYKALVYGVLKDFPDVVIFDPADELCDLQRCWAVRNGQSLYQDPDHLSGVGSELVVHRLAPLIRQLLDSSR